MTLVNKLADNMKDLDMINGRLFIRDGVLEHFGVPREIMGITENSNRATAEAAQYIYATNVMTPRIADRERAINRQLLPYFGRNLIWRFDDIIPHDKEHEKAVAMEGYNYGLLTKDEAREKLSMPEVARGKIFKVQYTDVYVDADADLTRLTSLSETDSSYEKEENADREIEICDEQKIMRLAEEIKKKQTAAAGNTIARMRIEQGRKFESATMRYDESFLRVTNIKVE